MLMIPCQDIFIRHSRKSGNPENPWIPGQARNDRNSNVIILFSSIVVR